MIPFVLGSIAGVVLQFYTGTQTSHGALLYISPMAHNPQNSLVFVDIVRTRVGVFGTYSSSCGRVCIELFDNMNPVAATNFRELCRGGQGNCGAGYNLCYSGTCITVDKNTLIGGDITFGSTPCGWSIYGQNFCEKSNVKDKPNSHCKGLVCAITRGSRIGSGFIINMKDSLEHNEYVAIGQIIEGYNVVQRVHEQLCRYSSPYIRFKILHSGVLKEPVTPNYRRGLGFLNF